MKVILNGLLVCITLCGAPAQTNSEGNPADAILAALKERKIIEFEKFLVPGKLPFYEIEVPSYLEYSRQKGKFSQSQLYVVLFDTNRLKEVTSLENAVSFADAFNNGQIIEKCIQCKRPIVSAQYKSYTYRVFLNCKAGPSKCHVGYLEIAY